MKKTFARGFSFASFKGIKPAVALYLNDDCASFSSCSVTTGTSLCCVVAPWFFSIWAGRDAGSEVGSDAGSSANEDDGMKHNQSKASNMRIFVIQSLPSL